LSDFYVPYNEINEVGDEDLRIILPRTGDITLAKQIVNYNILISTLSRLDDLIFYSRLKSNKMTLPDDIQECVKFTKGYAILYPPHITNVMNKYLYTRKLYSKSPLKIKQLKVSTIVDSLNNKNYSNPI